MSITCLNEISKESAEHIAWIDIMKGILICLMVLGHCGVPFVKVIYMFHMPAFMFISAYTSKPEKYRFSLYIWKKCRNILFPYVFWNLLFLAIYIFFEKNKIYIFFAETQSFSVINFFKYLATTDLGGATWFLPVIFTASVIYQAIFICLRVFSKERLAPYIAMIIGWGGFQLCQADRFLPYLLDLSLYSMLYYGLGQLFARHNIFEKFLPKKDMMFLCFATIILFGYFYPTLMMNWPTRDFVGLPENVISAICGIYICYRAAIMLLSGGIFANFVELLGKNTMVVLVLHFAIFRVIFAVFVLIGIEPLTYLRNLTPLNDWPLQWAIVAIGTLVICGLLAVAVSHTKILKFVFSGRLGD